jgi:protein-L-isoaspartate(D-aspartate) O-methyltransferase
MGEAADDLRNALVDRMVASGAVRTAAVEAALRRVPRHRLLEDVWLPSADDPLRLDGLELHVLDRACPDPALLQRLYGDFAVVTRQADGLPTSSTSQPSLVATMLELLELEPGLRVLEVGAGTGYNAALLSEVVGDQALVCTVDIDADVVAQTRRLLAEAGYGAIEVLTGDGACGHAAAAPYDRIVATVGCTDLSPHWLDQLAPGGFLLIPLEHGGVHPLTDVRPAGDRTTGRVVGCSGFMRIRGDLARELVWPRVAFRREGGRRPLPPALRDLATTDGTWPGWDFHYYLALADRRTAGPVALSDAGGAVRADFFTGDLLVSGHAEHLLEELLAHLDSWDQLGRPRAGDWRSEFVPMSQAGPVPDGAGLIRRIHYLQNVELA